MRIYKEESGEELTVGEAREMTRRFLELYALLAGMPPDGSARRDTYLVFDVQPGKLPAIATAQARWVTSDEQTRVTSRERLRIVGLWLRDALDGRTGGLAPSWALPFLTRVRRSRVLRPSSKARRTRPTGSWACLSGPARSGGVPRDRARRWARGTRASCRSRPRPSYRPGPDARAPAGAWSRPSLRRGR